MKILLMYHQIKFVFRPLKVIYKIYTEGHYFLFLSYLETHYFHNLKTRNTCVRKNNKKTIGLAICQAVSVYF